MKELYLKLPGEGSPILKQLTNLTVFPRTNASRLHLQTKTNPYKLTTTYVYPIKSIQLS